MASWNETAKSDLENLKKQLEAAIAAESARIADENSKNPHWYPPNPIYYWTIVGVCLAYQAVIMAWAAYSLVSGKTLFFGPMIFKLIGMPVNIPLFVLLLHATWLILSIKSIAVDQLAGISFAGRPLYPPTNRQAISGLYFVPYGILKLISAKRNYRDKRFPGPAEKVFRVSSQMQRDREGGDKPPEGMLRPIFVMTGAARLTDEEREKRESGGFDPLDRRLSIEIAYTTRFRPDQEYGGIFRIARNLSATTGDIDTRIEDLIGEQSERDIKSVITRLTPAMTIENWSLVNEVFWLTLRLSVLRLGIDIDRNGTGLVDINASHDTNEAQADVARAEFKKSATITAAEGTRQQRTLEGEGTANARRALLVAEAEGYAQIMRRTKTDGETVVASQTAKEALGDKTVILGTEGVAQMLGLVQVGKAMFSKSGAAAKAAPPPPDSKGGT